ncbi:MAG: hypothetical protein HC852_04890 [Acaryochloridaceae cyanobacterium RU_4_10]|nr:hypothetical protein [Acaryochloridaceae cyanobacterium RU_4_10]
MIKSATESIVIQWKTRPVEPFVQGLRLQGKQPIYLEAPTLWLPPMAQETTLNLLIDNVTHKSVIARSAEIIATNQWRSLSLKDWLQTPGRYEVKLWNISFRWSHRFEICEKYYFPKSAQHQPKIRHDRQDCAHLPVQVETVAKFWAAQLQIDGLWPLESVTLLLSNGQDASSCTLQADRIGILEISVAKLHELLPKAEYYVLGYQVLGQENQQLIEVGRLAETVSISPPIPSETESDSSAVIDTKTVKPIEKSQASTVSNWHLVTIKSRKRDIFCKQIQHRLNNSRPEETGIVTFQLCPADIYADYVLVQAQKMSAARKTLQSIEHFMRIEPKPLTEADVKRMLGT